MNLFKTAMIFCCTTLFYKSVTEVSSIPSYDTSFYGCDKITVTGGKAKLNCNSMDKTENQAFINISFYNYTTYESISINNKNFPRLKGSLFTNLSITNFLSLQKNEIEFISSETFSDIVFLSILDLSSNKLISISEVFSSFKNNIYLNSNGVFSSLKRLRLSENQLRNISEIFPKPFENLNVLDIRRNKLDMILNKSFQNLKNLNQIELASNQLKSIAKLFTNLSNLIDLNLEYNQIKNFTDEDLFGLTNLQTLKVGKNSFITNISKDSFQSLKSVEIINFGSDRIGYLDRSLFSKATKLKKLNFQDNSILSIDNGFLIPLKSLTELYLQNNKIKSIGNMSLNSLVLLEEANFENNQIDSIEENSFFNLSSLTNLNLCQNNISYLVKNTFIGLKKLTNISLKRNRISLEQLDNNIFDYLDKVTFLDLSYNLIHMIPNNVFSKLSNLISLNLNNNFIKDIDEKMLSGLYNLVDISVSFNQIKFIKKETFSTCCKRMKSWKLNSNLIETIEFLFSNSSSDRVELTSNLVKSIKKDFFKNLKSVSYLILNDNKIESIELKCFENFSTLTLLDLSQNKLIDLKSGIFENNSNLTSLDLSFNSLSSVKNQTFKGLNRLEYLNLESNYITHLEENLFTELNSLKTLILGFNKIMSISTNFISPNNKVETLMLNNNNIGNITFLNGSLRALNSKLKFVNLSNNYIKKIQIDQLNLPKLEDIDMSNNQISQIETNSFKKSNLINFTLNNLNKDSRIPFYLNLAKDFVPNITKLALSNNRIIFKSDENNDSSSMFFNLKMFILEKNTEPFYTKNILSLCPNLEYLDLSENILIFEKNISLFSSLKNLQTLILGEILLDSFDLIDFSSENSLTQLDLNGNRIMNITVNQMKNLYKLKKLELSNNNISFIEDNSFANLSDLTYLNLENNQLKRLHYDAFHNKLAELYVGKNLIPSIMRLNRQYLKVLKIFDLSFNRLNSANLTVTFSEASILETLKLSNNFINSIKKEDFQLFESLCNLILSSNMINATESFKKLAQLQVLALDDNNLSKFDSDTFVGLYRLEFLNLSSNTIRSVDRLLFKDLFSLKVIDLSNNDLRIIEDTSKSMSFMQVENLYLQKNLNLQLSNESLAGLENIQNIFINIEVFYDLKNKVNFNKSLIHKQNKFISYNEKKRIYYHSIFVTANNANGFVYNNELDCFLVLYFIRHKVHLNLKTDYEMERYFEYCFKLELIYFSQKDESYLLIDISTKGHN
jgi:Leucine-rich repeat (LRR) protein